MKTHFCFTVNPSAATVDLRLKELEALGYELVSMVYVPSKNDGDPGQIIIVMYKVSEWLMVDIHTV